MDKKSFSSITGWLAILVDLLSLIGFTSGIIKPSGSSFFLHPALLLVLQLAITIYGNVAIAFSYVLKINRIYEKQKEYTPADVEKTLLLFSYLTWVPSFLIWVVSYYIVAGGYELLDIYVGGFSFFALFFGGTLISSWGALLSRTLHPELPIKISIQ